MNDKPASPETTLERLFIGGNHLASSLLSYGCHPAEQTSYDQVLGQHGLLCADMWVAWRAIMDVREEKLNG